MRLFKKRTGRDFFLTLDIGTEAVKCLAFLFDPKAEDKKTIIILAGALEYFNKYGSFESNNIEEEMMKKAIERAIKGVLNAIFSSNSINRHIKDEVLRLNKKKWNVLLSFSPDVLRAEIVCSSFLRKDPYKGISASEEKDIYKNILRDAEKNVFEGFADKSGIMPKDISLVSCSILKMKIEGYPVSLLKDYKGKEIEIKALLSFIPNYYKNIGEKIIRSLGFKKIEIVHLASGIKKVFNKKNKNGLVVDVGGKITQIFGIKDGHLEGIEQSNKGGSSFIESLSDSLGVSEELSRMMAENYSKEETEKIKEIFLSEKNEWYNNIIKKIEKMPSLGVFSSSIFLLGGGSLLPEVKNVLSESKGISQNNFSEVEFIKIKDLECIKLLAENLDNPQWIPSLIICYNIK